MEYTMRRIAGFAAIFSLILGVFAPVSAEAAMDLYNPKKRYGDEKTDIVNPASRCLTAAAKAARTRDLKTFLEDGKKAGVVGEEEHELSDEYEKYETALEFAWGALEEPYCGFGAFGSSASLKSYQKTVLRARAAFLDAVKKNK
ncbi:hypothetical protein KBD34_02030 [Patescibacteria group bacterium]|nr:hypothetical protein [Patescibacteria group bacterium]